MNTAAFWASKHRQRSSFLTSALKFGAMLNNAQKVLRLLKHLRQKSVILNNSTKEKGPYLKPIIGHSLQMLHLAWCFAVSAAATRWRTGSQTIDWGSKRIQSRKTEASSSGLLLAFISEQKKIKLMKTLNRLREGTQLYRLLNDYLWKSFWMNLKNIWMFKDHMKLRKFLIKQDKKSVACTYNCFEKKCYKSAYSTWLL